MSDLVLTTVDEGTAIATLTMNRPEARNPTSIAMLDALDGALDLVTADERILAWPGTLPRHDART